MKVVYLIMTIMSGGMVLFCIGWGIKLAISPRPDLLFMPIFMLVFWCLLFVIWLCKYMIAREVKP